jgi:hypothetical protein
MKFVTYYYIDFYREIVIFNITSVYDDFVQTVYKFYRSVSGRCLRLLKETVRKTPNSARARCQQHVV